MQQLDQTIVFLSDILTQLQSAQALAEEVKTLSLSLHETADILRNKDECRCRRFDSLPDYISVKQFAVYLNVGLSQANKLVSAPDFPRQMPFAGTKRIYDKNDVKAWIEKQKSKGNKRFRII